MGFPRVLLPIPASPALLLHVSRVLTLINRPFNSIPLHVAIGGIAALAEIARVITTIVIQKRDNNELGNIVA